MLFKGDVFIKHGMDTYAGNMFGPFMFKVKRSKNYSVEVDYGGVSSFVAQPKDIDDITIVSRGETYKKYIKNWPFEGVDPVKINSQLVYNHLKGYNYFCETVRRFQTYFDHENSLFLAQPRFFYEGDKVFCEIWDSFKGVNKGVEGRVRIRAGKALKKILPHAEDEQIEDIINKVKDQLIQPVYTLNSGKERKDFKHAYSYVRSPQKSTIYTNIANSCMRFAFSTLPCHPAEVYASGDFTIYWLEDEQGRIAGRVVYCNVTNTHGVIYVASTQAYKILSKKMEELKADEDSFEGATLLRIEHDGKIIGVYPDYDEYVRDCGTHLEIGDGDLLRDADGYFIDESKPLCECCNEVRGDHQYVNSVRMYVCEDCLENDFFVSEYSEEYFNNRYVQAVWISKHETEIWYIEEACENAIWVESQEQFWVEGKVVQTIDGEYITQYQLEEDGDWKLDKDGFAEPVEMELEV